MKKYEEIIISKVFNENVAQHMLKKEDPVHLEIKSVDKEAIGYWTMSYSKISVIVDKPYVFSSTFTSYNKGDDISLVYKAFNQLSFAFTLVPDLSGLEELHDVTARFYNLLNKKAGLKFNSEFTIKSSFKDFEVDKILISYPMFSLNKDAKVITLKTGVMLDKDNFYILGNGASKKYNRKYFTEYISKMVINQVIADLNKVLSLDISPEFDSNESFCKFLEDNIIVIDMMIT